MDVLCELYPVEMTAIFASKRIFAAAATGGARTAELPIKGWAKKILNITCFVMTVQGLALLTEQKKTWR